jgi:hypothetical protein
VARIRSWLGRITAVAAAVLAAGLLAGCGGGAPDTPAAGGPATTGTGADTGANTGSNTGSGGSDAGGGSPTRHRGGVKVVAWLRDLAPLGGGASGADEEAWADFVSGRCEGPSSMPASSLPEPMASVYVAGDAACQAAFRGRADQWAVAAGRIGQAEAADLDCVERAVVRATRRLLDEHRADPDVTFTLDQPGGGGADAYGSCPAVAAADPDHGDPAGGYPVRLTGSQLPGSFTAVLNLYSDNPNGGVSERAVTVPATSTDGTHATITMISRPDGVTSMSIWAEGWPWRAQGSAEFAYDLPPSPAGPTTDGPSPDATSPDRASTDGATTDGATTDAASPTASDQPAG